MKKISYTHSLLLPLFLMMVALFPACKKSIDSSGAPVITSVRMNKPSPADILMSSGNPSTDPNWSGGTGQYVVIIGQNLQNATEIDFDGVPATFNNALFSPSSAVVPTPSIIYSTIDVTKLYTLQYTTTSGTTTFSFKLGPEAPVIQAISNVFANPGDSIFIIGTDLVLVQSFSYGGAKITSFKSNYYGTTLGFVMPTPAPTTGNVEITTKTGTAIYKISATPTITSVSNEDALSGDSVHIYGAYLKSIQTFTFAGAAITSFVSSADGTSVAFKMPSISSPGPVSVTTPFGTATTVYNVNNTDVEWAGKATTGILANMEWGDAFGWSWWGGSNLSVSDPNSTGGWLTLCADMTGNTGMFMSIKEDPLAGSTSGNQIPIGDAQWIPSANLTDPVENWALKFEINIPKPWNGGTIRVQSGFTGSYIARVELWQTSSTSTAAVTTKGWRTVTIPLTEFRSKDATLGEGKGVSVPTLANLLGSGKTGCNVSIKNYDSSITTSGFYGGFDNFRVVKIK